MPKARKKTGGNLLKVAPKKKKRITQKNLDEKVYWTRAYIYRTGY